MAASPKKCKAVVMPTREYSQDEMAQMLGRGEIRGHSVADDDFDEPTARLSKRTLAAAVARAPGGPAGETLNLVGPKRRYDVLIDLTAEPPRTNRPPLPGMTAADAPSARVARGSSAPPLHAAKSTTRRSAPPAARRPQVAPPDGPTLAQGGFSYAHLPPPPLPDASPTRKASVADHRLETVEELQGVARPPRPRSEIRADLRPVSPRPKVSGASVLLLAIATLALVPLAWVLRAEDGPRRVVFAMTLGPLLALACSASFARLLSWRGRSRFWVVAGAVVLGASILAAAPWLGTWILGTAPADSGLLASLITRTESMSSLNAGPLLIAWSSALMLAVTFAAGHSALRLTASPN